jgi:hypothetical protein
MSCLADRDLSSVKNEACEFLKKVNNLEQKHQLKLQKKKKFISTYPKLQGAYAISCYRIFSWLQIPPLEVHVIESVLISWV